MSQGYFIDEKKEYVITDMYPKRPLMNYMWNDSVMLRIDQFGFGSLNVWDTKRRARNHVNEGDNRHVYVMDRDSGEYYSANRNYGDLPFKVRETHVGQGYSTFISEYNGVRVEFKIFVPVEERAECWEIKVINTSDTEKKLSVYPFIRVPVCSSGHQAYVRAEYNERLGGLFSREEGYAMPCELYDRYFVTDAPVSSWCVADYEFTGVYNSPANPLALENGGELSSFGTCFVPQCDFAFKHDFDLAAGEEKVIHLVYGGANSEDHAAEILANLHSAEAFAANLAKLEEISNMYDDNVSINTSDENVNRFVNIWLKRQIAYGKTWARGGYIGSRDTMQDVTSFVSLDPVVSRQRLLYGAQYIRENGNITRGFFASGGTLAHDCSTWTITAFVQYIKETGDFSILDEECGYFESELREPILDHLLRASKFLLEGVGEHGWTLWGECDWNDSLNACGIRGKGESLWLAEASVKCCGELSELLRRLGKNDIADDIDAKREVMKANIIKYGWEKDHFIYGINDFGEKVGTYESADAKSYLNSQTWAVLADIYDADKLNTLMDYVEDTFGCDFGYTQVSPCHAVGTDHIGRSSYFQKGCYENGSVYNHGCTFKLVADCYLKRGNQAYDSVLRMLPTNPKNPSSHSGMEPYAISNMYIGPENEFRAGYSPMHWITGTCGWLFRGVVEYMIGVQAEYDGLAINPAMPEAWKNVSVHRTFRGCVYDIDFIQNCYNGALSITVDGKAIEGNILPYFEDGAAHKVVVNIG